MRGIVVGDIQSGEDFSPRDGPPHGSGNVSFPVRIDIVYAVQAQTDGDLDVIVLSIDGIGTFDLVSQRHC